MNYLAHLYLDRILPRMVFEDWLGSYFRLSGVGQALDRLAGRLSRGNGFKGEVVEIESNYRGLESDFLSFFPDLVAFSESLEVMRGTMIPS